METFFHNFTMTRWQGALFKICVASFGILLGIYVGKYLKKVIRLRWTLFVGAGMYLIYLYFTQPITL